MVEKRKDFRRVEKGFDSVCLIMRKKFSGNRAVTKVTAASFEKGLGLGQSRPSGENLRLSSGRPPLSKRPALGSYRGQMTENRHREYLHSRIIKELQYSTDDERPPL